MKQYKLINVIGGWVAFLAAAIVYLLTIEPTASWWDCGEFIATANKLEVGHPPGAPFFMLLGRFFSLFAGNDVTLIALMINVLSALASAFTVMFTFWIITHMAKKMVAPGKLLPDMTQTLLIIGAGIVGALAFTFTDSFWFSAVEGEVYATSSLFTALVFWAILKWENVADEKHADRWIILIALLIGISIGIHLLNLLAIPAITFVIYFKKYKPTTKGIIFTAILSFIILSVVQYGVISGIVQFASKFELLFVNNLGMGFGSGIIFYSVLFIALVVFGLWYTQKKNKKIWNTAILVFTFIMVGYSSYAAILIRSQANTPLNENAPSNIFTFLSYLNREQYGDRPLMYGQYWAADYEYDSRGMPVQKEKGKIYVKGEKKYEEVGIKKKPVYKADDCTLFPRMYSADPKHVRAYKQWSGARSDKKPSFGKNMKFLFRYQVGYMYVRYFMWNFVGRQNDIQGHGFAANGARETMKGNWISGIPFVDKRLGNQMEIPADMKNNAARNTFFFLPFILGLIGVYHQFKTNKKDGFIVTLLFILTGLAIVIYLNQYPFQPRERDYAYAGSFMAFCVWIGLGVIGLYRLVSKVAKGPAVAGGIILLTLVVVPGVMGQQGWDDHDRSNKTAARDFAINYLNSCEPNAILITNGDNDTFPLWYAQEVEGVRTDIRVLNFTLSSGDWYIHQLKNKLYESEALPLSLEKHQYTTGSNDYIPFFEKTQEGINLKEFIKLIANESPDIKVRVSTGSEVNYLPSKKLYLPIDTNAIINKNLVPDSLKDRVLPYMAWEVKKNYLYKNDLMILDLIASNNWERPIYFVNPSSVRQFLDVDRYCHLEGFVYRLMPVMAEGYIQNVGGIHAEKSYNLFMNEFLWGNLADSDVYVDRDSYNMGLVLRNSVARVASTLISKGQTEKAIEVMNKITEVLPNDKIPYDVYMLSFVQNYYMADEMEKGNEVAIIIAEYYDDYMNFYFSLKPKDMKGFRDDMEQAKMILQRLYQLSNSFEQLETSNQIKLFMDNYGIEAPPPVSFQ